MPWTLLTIYDDATMGDLQGRHFSSAFFLNFTIHHFTAAYIWGVFPCYCYHNITVLGWINISDANIEYRFLFHRFWSLQKSLALFNFDC